MSDKIAVLKREEGIGRPLDLSYPSVTEGLHTGGYSYLTHNFYSTIILSKKASSDQVKCLRKFEPELVD